MKYIILILLGVAVAVFSSTHFLTKKEPVKSIDTIICRTVERYGEDLEVGDKYLVISTECDTIYKK
jgi:hypothetical protein